MQKRRFGRTGHMSTVAIFGGAAFSKASAAEAELVMPQVIALGVNHIDIAPSYGNGNAETLLGPWLARERQRFFLGCKTMERTKEGAWAEMHRSFERLQTDKFELYQFHAVNTFEELDKVFAQGGALQAVLQAREQGLTKYIGITGHGVDAPAIFLEALRRFDFDSVLFPLNFVQYANPTFRANAQALLAECCARDVGVMVIKSICKRPWGDRPKMYRTWYEPFDESDEIRRAVGFALSQDVTGICTASEPRILPKVLDACDRFLPMNAADQEAMIASASQYEPLFA